MPVEEHSSRGNSKGKGPEVGPSLACLRASKEASEAAVKDGGGGTVGGDCQRWEPDCARPQGPSMDSSFD